MRSFFIAGAVFVRVAIVVAALSALLSSATAETNRLTIPKGVTPQIEGNTVTMRNNNGVSGSFSCTCSKSGACSVSNTGTAIICLDIGGTNHCTGSCSLGTVISGAKGGSATMSKSQK